MADVTDVSSLPYPELTDQPNGPDAFLDLTGALDHLVIPKYANSTARSNANTSPVAGDLCYLTDVAGYFHYNGSDWERLGFRQQFKRKTASTSISNDATYTADPHLVGFVMLPGVRYIFRGNLFVSSHTTADFKCRFTGTGLNTTNYPTNSQTTGYWGSHTSTGDHRARRWSEEIAVPTDRDSMPSSAGIDAMDMYGIFVNPTGSPITMNLEWAQNSSQAITTTLTADSWISFERV